LQHFWYVCSVIIVDIKFANACLKNTAYFNTHFPVFHILVTNNHQDMLVGRFTISIF